MSAAAAGRVGVDTGGTFTDVVTSDGRIAKVLSTPSDPSVAVVGGVEAVGGASVVAHGTTVATNAVLERRGARVALVTNEGFADVIEIARQNRPSLYDAFADRPPALVARDDRVEVRGRLAADGSELVPVDVSSLSLPGAVPDGVEAIAVCLLHSDLNASHEVAVASVLRERGFDVTCSHEVSPEFREYERTVTTVLNAYVRPVCRRYLSGLQAVAPAVEVMTSAGGLLTLAEAGERPVALLLSGPAGGVAAGAAAAVASGFPDAVTFDMGGTSTDVCLVLDGAPAPAAQRSVGGYPVRLPSLDIHTIGAGGGSVARLDAGGALVVGPESAGAAPGPACYGLGGSSATVTDADLVCGRIPASAAFPGLGTLSVGAAREALAGAGVSAEGVIAVVDEGMVQAVRAVTVERGVDPRGLALVAFGGAGPLHACALAAALEMRAVVVPPRAGVLSAVGLVGARRQVDLVRSWPTPASWSPSALEDAAVELATVASAALGGGAAVDVAFDCRYAGQSHELTVPDVSLFGAEHERRNGYVREGAAVEVVAVRASARAAAADGVGGDGAPSLPAVADRRPAVGPAVLVEEDCTVWVPEGWQADVHEESGSWILRRCKS